VANGSWYSASTWSGGVVPTFLDRVTIDAAHTVHIASAGLPAHPTIAVNRLTVNGTLITDDTPGYPDYVALAADRFTVNMGGRILGRDGTGTDPGASITFGGLTRFVFVNDGLVAAGGGLCGGNLGFIGADLSNPSVTNSFSSSGTCSGGQEGGSVTVRVREITITNGLIHGGDSSGVCCPGSVNMHAETLFVVSDGVLRGGSGPTSCGGGRVSLRTGTTGVLTVGSSAELIAGSVGGVSTCVQTWAGTQFILGTITGSACIDPPDVRISDTATMMGEVIEIGGANVSITDLFNPGQIQATQSLRIFVNPGGILDLRGLPEGDDWLIAPQATIYADTILLDPGVTLDEIISPATPVVLPGQPYVQVCLTPTDASYAVANGFDIAIPYQATNCGSATSSFTVTRSGPAIWLGNPGATTQSLAPGAEITGNIRVTVPSDPGETQAQVTLSVTATNGAAASTTLTFVVPKGPELCPADWNDDGVSNSTDVSDFINDWFTDQTKGTTVTDFNDDGVSNSTDVSDFINAWFTDIIGPCGG